MITAAVVLVAAVCALAAVRLNQRPGRHRDHGHPGADPGYARLLASWNRAGRTADLCCLFELPIAAA